MRLIDADKIHPEGYAIHGDDLNRAYLMIDNAQTEDAEIIIHAYWEQENPFSDFRCFNCKNKAESLCMAIANTAAEITTGMKSTSSRKKKI